MAITRSMTITGGNIVINTCVGSVSCADEYGGDGGIAFSQYTDLEEFIAALREAADFAFHSESRN